MSFKLKDWYGNEKIYNYDKIFFRDENDELVQFTQGKGEAALESLEVTKNGSYTPPEGVDGFNQVTVNVEEDVIENLLYYEEHSFSPNSDFYGLYTAYRPFDGDNFEIVPDQEYIITWDMQYYSVFAQDASSMIPGAFLLGNGTAVDLSGNDEPFAIVWTKEGLTFVSSDDSANHGVAIMKRVRPKSMILQNVTITENGEYSAPERYDGFGKVTVNVKSEEELNEILMYYQEIEGFSPNSTYGGMYTADCPDDIANFEIVVGQEYVVMWDDGYYSVIAQDASSVISGAIFLGNGSGLGLSGNGEPFAIGYNPYGVMFISADANASHSIGIIKRVRHQDLLLQDITITENGEYNPDAAFDGFGNVKVEVPAPEIILQDKTITENGTFTADDGYDGLGSVTVDVKSADVRYVTFMSYDGLVEYGKKAVALGDDCADPIVRGIFGKPTRESDAQYDYTHSGWANEPNGVADSEWNKAVTENKTVYAAFNGAVRYYTITYYDENGTTVLNTQRLSYGTMPSYEPTKNGYKFVAWQPALAEVTGDASYKASWATKAKLADYTWAELDAMTLAEMKENFELGDKKGNYTLVGFEQDTLASGGKARMTFIGYHGSVYTSKGKHTSNYHDGTFYKNMQSNPATYIKDYADLSSVAKTVVKKYVSDRTTPTISNENLKFWIPAASELGFAVDGTLVLDEGAKYDLFPEIENTSKFTTIAVIQYVKVDLRSSSKDGSLYINSGKLTNITSTSVSSVYYTCGFCI